MREENPSISILVGERKLMNPFVVSNHLLDGAQRPSRLPVAHTSQAV
jgi:hypothetical protein